MVFGLILVSLIALDVIWWRWADRQVRRLPGAKKWRVLVGVFVAMQVLGFAGIILSRVLWMRSAWVPVPVLGGVFVWHLLVVPATMALVALGAVLGWMWKGGRWVMGGQVKAVEGTGPTRRDVLMGAVAAVPPLLTMGSVGAAMANLWGFRVRRLTVNVPGLPAALEGLTIAHLSDVHTGAFTPAAKLAAIVERANALKPDLVVMTGDLIDYALEDLPAGLKMMLGLKSRYGLFTCEGNHDLFEDREEFEDRVRAAGVGLLMDEGKTVLVNGQPVQVLGLGYGWRRERNPMLEMHMQRALAHRRDDAFPILLSHHPHAFDLAEQVGIPLTLAGHTHGGQLMLSESIGAGPMLFKYWSGLYRKGRGSLVVSNGIGNWFPLRINAPAEIGYLTLRGVT